MPMMVLCATEATRPEVQKIVRSNLESAGRAGPALDIPPVPKQNSLKFNYRLREFGVAATPIMDQVGSLHIQAFSDFGCSY